MKHFVKLEQYSDWGLKYLAQKGKGLSPQGTACKAEYGIRFHKGQSVHIKWSNGAIELVELWPKLERSVVHDMGHKIEVTNQIMGFYIQHNDSPVWVNLLDVKVQLL